MTHNEGSRHELFESVDSLAAASSFIGVVEIDDQNIIDGKFRETLSTAAVITSFEPPSLASSLSEAPAVSGDTVIV
ncbi:MULTISPECIES: hypothetical protein [Microbacterium]|uniref:hypothetical protein n=1 Tax=Microbacterium TaxID=33882 RepID=UPI00217D91FB|nr:MULTISPECIES: hypothetical protein [Microbacterium]UWF77458.1 hypothetical protein JSY13_12020 [Microbacterium neungamense]WCM55621.1 hypothetical protein JRG78_12030 [Microbacterium sp. EF45047]